MKLIFYKLMYRLTNDRRWLLAYIDEMEKQILDNIARFRTSKEM